jgi:hypothetical protein
MKMKQQRQQPGKRPCGGKIGYPTKTEAEQYLSLLKDLRGIGSKTEARAYHCRKCERWHLTSKKRRSR